jgi:N,N'-diacetyllegionaminate synthase
VTTHSTTELTTEMSIGDRMIGEGFPTLVIAEIGVNHDGDVQRAIQLVRDAARAGADAIKLQLFSADRLVSHSAECASYQQAATGDTNQQELLRQYELSVDDVERVMDVARVEGLIALATPFSVEDVFVCEQLNLPAIKIASPDLVNLPLLRRSMQAKKPLMISTGASNQVEIQRTCDLMKQSNTKAMLMHCVSSYPTSAELANLSWIGAMRRRFGLLVGYSDHTTELLAGAMAVSAGAVVVEKHLTWSRYATGPDHSASFDPTQFAVYVQHIRTADAMRGVGERDVLLCEHDVRRLSRQSVIAARDIEPGELISHEMLAVRRPGTGIAAWDIDRVVGRVAGGKISAGESFSWSSLREQRQEQAA